MEPSVWVNVGFLQLLPSVRAVMLAPRKTARRFREGHFSPVGRLSHRNDKCWHKPSPAILSSKDRALRSSAVRRHCPSHVRPATTALSVPVCKSNTQRRPKPVERRHDNGTFGRGGRSSSWQKEGGPGHRSCSPGPYRRNGGSRNPVSFERGTLAVGSHRRRRDVVPGDRRRGDRTEMPRFFRRLPLVRAATKCSSTVRPGIFSGKDVRRGGQSRS